MDNFMNTKGKKINNKRELHLFYSTITSFEKLLFTKQNIQTLVIIGQRNITFLNAISELIQLQELWIVECGIKDIPAFKENCLLRKLYLYSNELPSIPNLEACTNLTTLFLSGNDIYELKNIDKLILLQELNLANNKLERINKISWKKSELHYLNLAGNYLCTMKILQQQLLTNMKYCGNLNFIEYNAFPENTITQLCKQFLEESLCSVIKGGIGITGLKLHKVVKVCNKEIDQLSNWKNEDLQSDECSTILKILISPGVTNIQKWPFNFFKTDLLIKVFT
ncbi:leucine-rich repeat-containing protein 9-like isoform X1 [Osmia bicornis bicornis]|uniref:leucine-rich repeat-containing protein 9-like isoform X1 n=1 Tax=Osmia bicornis bicornis TaxID=1437191 RepID=UPI001EAF5D6B|nr:leucine-rich repeat-containing protein 9-like isoform X1 [Osmia bicornis bicornis]